MRRFIDMNSEEFWQVLFDEACVEGKQAERIENDLNKIAVDEKEIRNKAIDEFAERLKDSLLNNYRHLITTDSDGFDWLTTDAVHTHIDKITEQLKGGAT